MKFHCHASLAALAFAVVYLVFPAKAENPRVVLEPKFSVGQTMVYEVETRTSTTGKVVGPIDNPESPSQALLTVTLRVRLEVLSLSAAPGGAESVRLRATYETSHAQASSDAVNPAAPDPAAPFAQLEGRSVEFSLAPGGAMTQFRGLEDISPSGTPPAAAILWIPSLVSSAGFPRNGIAPGQQWAAEQPVEGVPLAGLFWRTQSTYLRAEPCKLVADSGAAAPRSPSQSPSPEQCAAILSRLSISRHGPGGHSDATPPDYLRNGLRTSGNWTGSGEALGSISLATGLLVSATQTSTQDYDYEIKSAATGSSIHYTGKVDSQTAITLVSFTAPSK